MSILLNEKWSIREKQKLEQLLRCYPLDAYQHIADKMKTKGPDQIQEYVEKLKYSVKCSLQAEKKSNRKDTGTVYRAPLEHWYDISRDLVEGESFDCSAHLSKVMSVISNLEEFPTKKIKGHSPPNYKVIYRYLSQILQGDRRDDIDQLPPLESAIVLDLLHSLMDVLSLSDTTVQRNVMCWKHRLIDERDNNKHPYPDNLRRAAENDFTEFIQLEEEKEDSKLNLELERHRIATEKPPSPTEEVEEPVISKSTYVSQPYSSGTAPQPYNYLSPTAPRPSSSGTQTVRRHKPGRRKKDEKPETPTTEIVMVMPPKHCKIINLASRRKLSKKDRKDGKYVSLNDSEEIVIEKDSDIVYNVTTSQLGQFSQKDSSQATGGVRYISPKLTLSTKELAALEERRASQKRKYESIQTERTSRPTSWGEKKPKLYSLNPFCLPVSLLDLDS